MNEADYLQNQLELFDKCECQPGGYIADSIFLKTSPEYFQAIKEWTFVMSCHTLQTPKFQYLDLVGGQMQDWLEADSVMLGGESSILNISEAPEETTSFLKGGEGYGLSVILEKPTDVPKKYFLSSTACKGIINRSAKRGKELPPTLKKALEQQIQSKNGGGNAIVKIRSGLDDGSAGKGALIGLEQSFTLSCNNDQTLFQDVSTVGEGQIEPIYSIGHDERSTQFEKNKTDPLTANDYKQPPVVAQPIDGGTERGCKCLNPHFSQGEKIYSQDGIYPTLRSGSDSGGRGYPNSYVFAEAFAIGNGQVNQLYPQDKVGALNCMCDPMKVVQEVKDDEHSDG